MEDGEQVTDKDGIVEFGVLGWQRAPLPDFFREGMNPFVTRLMIETEIEDFASRLG